VKYTFYETVGDVYGNAVSNADVYVYLSGTTTAAKVYIDGSAVTTAPQTSTDSFGFYTFQVDDDDYSYTQTFDIKVAKSGYVDKWIKNINIIEGGKFVRLDGNSLPEADNTYDVGDSTHRFKNIYAVNFNGTASSATYADIAEKYTIEDIENVKVGDVIIISDKDEFDGKVSDEIASNKVIGVVSENPAFKMNSNLENGKYIALRGRVKCRIFGVVSKGEELVSYVNGCAIGINNVKNFLESYQPVGKSLENKRTSEVGLIEIIV